jgi:IS6 family transposase
MRAARATRTPPSGGQDATGVGGGTGRWSPTRRRERNSGCEAHRVDCVRAVVAEWLAERGLSVNRSTVYRWVRRYVPLLGEAARRYRHPVGGRWRVDETYGRLHGRWAYCYRAIDQDGQVVDVYCSKRRNAAAAEAFFARAIEATGVRPARVVTDKAACYPPALRVLLPAAEHRTSKYLNNGLERDHGHLKQRLRPMRGFKQLAAADSLTRGHALVQNLRNGFSTLTDRVPRPLRLATAWPQLARAI